MSGRWYYTLYSLQMDYPNSGKMPEVHFFFVLSHASGTLTLRLDFKALMIGVGVITLGKKNSGVVD